MCHSQDGWVTGCQIWADDLRESWAEIIHDVSLTTSLVSQPLTQGTEEGIPDGFSLNHFLKLYVCPPIYEIHSFKILLTCVFGMMWKITSNCTFIRLLILPASDCCSPHPGWRCFRGISFALRVLVPGVAVQGSLFLWLFSWSSWWWFSRLRPHCCPSAVLRCHWSPVAKGNVCLLECHAVLFLVFSKRNKTQSPINTAAI